MIGMAMLNALPDFLASLVFPPVCETCGSPLSPRVPGLCGRCRSSLEWLSPPFCNACGRMHNGPGRCGRCESSGLHFDRAYACALYAGPIRDALHGYKFGRRKALKVFFAEALARFAEDHLTDGAKTPQFDVVAAVPLDAARRRERGFNQSALLAGGLARRFGLPDLSPKLLRPAAAAAQSLLGKADRQSNVCGQFRVGDPASFASKRVLLVDDVLTTGQTASECARALKNAGAASVTVLACARGA